MVFQDPLWVLEDRRHLVDFLREALADHQVAFQVALRQDSGEEDRLPGLLRRDSQAHLWEALPVDFSHRRVSSHLQVAEVDHRLASADSAIKSQQARFSCRGIEHLCMSLVAQRRDSIMIVFQKCEASRRVDSIHTHISLRSID